MKPVYNDRGMKVPGMYEMGGSTKEYEEGGEQCEMVGWPPRKKCSRNKNSIINQLNKANWDPKRRKPRFKQSKKAKRNTGNRRR
jgi:hypothetical protein